jgi:hypothetical protein
MRTTARPGALDRDGQRIGERLRRFFCEWSIQIMKSTFLRTMTMGCALLALSLAAHAGVTSDPETLNAYPGKLIHVPLTLHADDYVAGVNGEMTYDAALFHSPVIFAGLGSQGFTVLGNETEAGKFRFVVYRNPTSILNLDTGYPLVVVNFWAADTLPNDTTQITYTIAAAARIDGTSFENAGTPEPEVSFSSVTVNLNRTPVEDWAIYE